jgi:hypothetical protein
LCCPRWAETSLQAAKLATKQKPFDFYRLATGLCRVRENINMCQDQMFHKYYRITADVLQSTDFVLSLFCKFNVDAAALTFGAVSY